MAKLTTKQFATKVNKTPGRIVQLIHDGTIVAERIADIYVIEDKYVEIIKARPEKRGRPKKVNSGVAA